MNTQTVAQAMAQAERKAVQRERKLERKLITIARKQTRARYSRNGGRF